MRRLAPTTRFRRAYARHTRRDPVARQRIDDVLRQMATDVFAPALCTHKLSGTLQGLWAASCRYDCRIVFCFETEPETGREVILLLDLGDHDTVY
ncbi:MAG: type II toxin-antitoxin system mRNA interferase toxin, RelE/StbE family [Armatimonadetes bacterium]|nr:type II toxin-antitoxin system mRNA interferase toxin, RelE/StbE family [Armatimonadota bacterium]